MEDLSYCTGRAWRVDLWVRGDDAVALVDEIGEFSDASAWLRIDGHSYRRRTPREWATEDDPLVEVHVALEPTPRVLARCGDRVVSLSRGDHRSELVRPATARETIEIGLRWILAWDHVGCVHLDEQAFWAPLTCARAFVVDDVPAWLARGAPVPTPLVDARLGVFVAFVGEDARMRWAHEAWELLEGRYPDATLLPASFCDFRGPARGLVAIAELRES